MSMLNTKVTEIVGIQADDPAGFEKICDLVVDMLRISTSDTEVALRETLEATGREYALQFATAFLHHTALTQMISSASVRCLAELVGLPGVEESTANNIGFALQPSLYRTPWADLMEIERILQTVNRRLGSSHRASPFTQMLDRIAAYKRVVDGYGRGQVVIDPGRVRAVLGDTSGLHAAFDLLGYSRANIDDFIKAILSSVLDIRVTDPAVCRVAHATVVDPSIYVQGPNLHMASVRVTWLVEGSLPIVSQELSRASSLYFVTAAYEGTGYAQDPGSCIGPPYNEWLQGLRACS
jgi:hypothetical protein